MAEAQVLLLLSGRRRPAGFARSVCGLLGAGRGRGPWPTHCGLRRGRLLLSAAPFPGATARLPLQRPAFCPFAARDAQRPPPGAEPPAGRGVDLGVAVVLQTRDRTVLLTRRARGLRVSPSLWVPPGGHVDPGEALLDAGLRELWEESGLRLPRGGFSWAPLGLWESAYPPRLSWGPPRYHHIVLYLLVVSQESQQQLQDVIRTGLPPEAKIKGSTCLAQARIQPNPSEVSAFLWLGPEVAAAVAASEDGTEAPRPPSRDLPPSVLAMELEEGEVRPLALPMSTLLRTTPATAAEGRERVSTGTKFALQLWLQHLGRVTPLTGARVDPGPAKEEQNVDPLPVNQGPGKPSA